MQRLKRLARFQDTMSISKEEQDVHSALNLHEWLEVAVCLTTVGYAANRDNALPFWRFCNRCGRMESRKAIGATWMEFKKGSGMFRTWSDGDARRFMETEIWRLKL